MNVRWVSRIGKDPMNPVYLDPHKKARGSVVLLGSGRGPNPGRPKKEGGGRRHDVGSLDAGPGTPNPLVLGRENKLLGNYVSRGFAD